MVAVREFNLLLDKPPEEAVISGETYKVKTDFRRVLQYQRIADDEELDEQEKITRSIALFFGADAHIVEDDIEPYLAWIGWFIRAGEEEKEEPSGERVFDFLQDTALIFAAFLQAYRINLRTAEVHWWTFRALVCGLPSGTRLADVMEIRGKKAESWMSAEQKAELVAAQERVRIRGRGERDIFAGIADGWA